MPAEKNETLEEHIIKKKVREWKFNTYIKINCPTWTSCQKSQLSNVFHVFENYVTT